MCRLVAVNSWIYFEPILFSLSLFSLRPVTHSVGDLMEQIRSEDRGIDRVVLKTIGKCIYFFYSFYSFYSSSTSFNSAQFRPLPGPITCPNGIQPPTTTPFLRETGSLFLYLSCRCHFCEKLPSVRDRFQLSPSRIILYFCIF